MRVAVWRVSEARSETRDGGYRESSRGSASNRWIFISIRGVIYIIRKDSDDEDGDSAYVFPAQSRNPRALTRETARRWYKLPRNSSRGSAMKAFRPGPKRFLHICNGSSNLCAFTGARPLLCADISDVVSFFPLNSAPRAPSCRSGNRVPQFIFHAWLRGSGASNKIERGRERELVSNCTQTETGRAYRRDRDRLASDRVSH